MTTNIKLLLLSIILCLWTSFAWAFPPGFIGAVTSGGVPVSPVLVGTSTLGPNTVAIDANTIYYYSSAFPTPQGESSLISGTGNNINVCLGPGIVPQTLWVYVADYSCTVLQKGSLTISGANSSTCVDVPLSSPVSISSPALYLLGIAVDRTATNIVGNNTRQGTSAVMSTNPIGDLSAVSTINYANGAAVGPLSVYLH